MFVLNGFVHRTFLMGEKRNSRVSCVIRHCGIRGIQEAKKKKNTFFSSVWWVIPEFCLFSLECLVTTKCLDKAFIIQMIRQVFHFEWAAAVICNFCIVCSFVVFISLSNYHLLVNYGLHFTFVHSSIQIVQYTWH